MVEDVRINVEYHVFSADHVEHDDLGRVEALQRMTREPFRSQGELLPIDISEILRVQERHRNIPGKSLPRQTGQHVEKYRGARAPVIRPRDGRFTADGIALPVRTDPRVVVRAKEQGPPRGGFSGPKDTDDIHARHRRAAELHGKLLDGDLRPAGAKPFFQQPGECVVRPGPGNPGSEAHLFLDKPQDSRA